MPLPELDPEARAAALEKAKRARRIRADLKERLKAGEIALRDLLDRFDQEDALRKMRVVEVLESLPNVGKVTAQQLMERFEIAESRRLQGLGPRQREALLAHFEDEA